MHAYCIQVSLDSLSIQGLAWQHPSSPGSKGWPCRDCFSSREVRCTSWGKRNLRGEYIMQYYVIYIYMHNICNIYSVVGRFISNICSQRRHIYRGAKRWGKYTAEVVYRGCGPTYRTRMYIYYILWWLRNRQTFCLETLPKTTPFLPGPYIADIRPPHNA